MKKIYSLVCALALGAGLASAQVTIGETNYASLEAAWVAAQSGDVIVLNEDVTVGESLLQSYFKGEITIKSAEGNTYTITRTSGKVGMFLAYAGDDIINLENVNLDGASIASEEPMVKAFYLGTVNMKNVNIVNGVNNGKGGIVNVSGSTEATFSANNVTISNCTVAGEGDVFVEGVVSVKNSCTFSAYLSDKGKTLNHITDKGLDGGLVTIYFNPEKYGYGDVAVAGAEDNTYFESALIEYTFAPENGNLVIAKRPAYVTNGELEYYSFNEAWAEAKSGDTLVLHKDVISEASCLSAYGKGHITVKSEEGKKYSISRTIPVGLFTATGRDSQISLENVTLDGKGIAAAAPMIMCSNHAIFDLKDVDIINGVTTSPAGIIGLMPADAYLNINNLTISDCVVPENGCEINVGSNVSLQGKCSFGAYLSSADGKITDNGVTAGRVELTFNPAAFTVGSVVVAGTESSQYYVCPDRNYVFAGKDGNLVIAENTYAVYNVGLNKYYETLAAAWAELAGDDVIELCADVTVDATMANNMKGNVTIKSAEGKTCTIARESDKTMFMVMSRNNVLNLENVIIDGKNVEAKNPAVYALSYGVANLKDVTISNCVNAATGRIVNGSMNGVIGEIENLTISDCNVDPYMGDVNVGCPVTIKGENNFSAFLSVSGTAMGKLTDGGVTGGNVTIYFDAAKIKPETVIVYGTESTDFYTCGTEGYGFVAVDGNLCVEKMYIHNVTTGKYYNDLFDACNWMEAPDGSVIELLADVTTDKFTINGTGAALTIKSAEGNTYKITRTDGTRAMFAATQGLDNLTFENVIIDGASIESAAPMITGSKGTINMVNTQLVNGATTGTNGLINISASTAKFNAEGFTTKDCTAPNNVDVMVKGKMTVKGENTFSTFLGMAGTATSPVKITADGVTGGKITVYYDATKQKVGNVVVNGTEASEYFACGVDGYVFVAKDGNLVVAEMLIHNVTTDKYFDNLFDACNWMNAPAGSVIELLGDVETDQYTINGPGAKLTIKSAEGHTYSIIRTSGERAMFNFGSYDDVTFENVILDGGIESSENPMITSTYGRTIKVTMKDVSIVYSINKATNGIIYLAADGADYTFENFSISNSIAKDASQVVISKGNVTAKGDCEFTAFVGGGKLTDAGVDAGMITVNFDVANMPEVIVYGTESDEFYISGVTGYDLIGQDGNLVASKTVGLDIIGADADAIVTVYNLQGLAVRVNVLASEALSDLPAGIYIVNGKKYLVKE